jgi:hypothetical protein
MAPTEEEAEGRIVEGQDLSGLEVSARAGSRKHREEEGGLERS